jgi:hypothetical protein
MAAIWCDILEACRYQHFFVLGKRLSPSRVQVSLVNAKASATSTFSHIIVRDRVDDHEHSTRCGRIVETAGQFGAPHDAEGW